MTERARKMNRDGQPPFRGVHSIVSAAVLLASAALGIGASRTLAQQVGSRADAIADITTHLPAMHPLLKVAPPWRTTPMPGGLRLATEIGWPDRPENRFVAVAERGNGKQRETWIGTPVGVKCVDRRAGMMHHYTHRDGLPDDNVAAVVADSDDVWCVTTGKETATLCAFDAPSNRWRTVLATALEGPPVTSYGVPVNDEARAIQYAVHPLLATSSRWLAFTSGLVGYGTDTVLHLLDKRTGKVTSIPWDPAMRADNNLLGPLALAFSDDDNVLLGTNLGLLRWNLTEKRWHRYLPRRIVESLAVLDHDTVWTVGKERVPNWYAYDSKRPVWTLNRVSLKNGQSAEWIPPDNTMPPKGQRVEPRTERLFRGSDQANLRTVVPVGVSVAPDGAVWTSHISSMELDDSYYSLMDSHGMSGQHGGFERFDPQSATWTAYPLRLTGKQDATQVLVGGSGEKGAIGLDDVPAAAVLPLARISTPFSPYGGYSNHSNLFWIRQRYPEWICLYP